MSVPLQAIKSMAADFDGKNIEIALPSLNPLNCWKARYMYTYYNVTRKSKRECLKNVC